MDGARSSMRSPAPRPCSFSRISRSSRAGWHGQGRGDDRPGSGAGGRRRSGRDRGRLVPGDVLTVKRDRYWPRSALTLVLLAVGFTAAAVQLVTPTRRWRPRLPGLLRRRSAEELRTMTRLARALRLLLLRRRRVSAAPAMAPDFTCRSTRGSCLAGPLDPELERIRTGLRPHRRRLWIRRIVRRAWIAAAAVAIVELAFWTAARFVPIEAAPAIGAALPILGLVGPLGRGHPRAARAGRNRHRRGRGGRPRGPCRQCPRAGRRGPGGRRTCHGGGARRPGDRSRPHRPGGGGTSVRAPATARRPRHTAGRSSGTLPAASFATACRPGPEATLVLAPVCLIPTRRTRSSPRRARSARRRRPRRTRSTAGRRAREPGDQPG